MPRTTNKQPKLHVKKGDRVRVIAGNAKGETGRILRVFPKTLRVVVEGINIRLRHTKPNKTHPQGGRIEREMPIHVSNVMPLDSNGEPTRVGRKWIDGPGGGHWVRVARTTGQELD